MKKKVTAVVLVVILAAIFTAGYIRINRKYPAPSVERIKAGQELEIQDGVFLTVTGWEILPEEEREAIYKKRGEEPLMDAELRKVFVTLENRTDETKQCEVTALNLETFGYSASINSGLGIAAMGESSTVVPELEPGQKLETAYLFEILKYQFTDRQWEEIDSREFWMTFSSYPVKTILELQKTGG